MSDAPGDSPGAGAAPKRVRPLWVSVLIVLLLLAGLGLVYYHREWADARRVWRSQGNAPYVQAHRAFLDDLETGRLDAAYQSTSDSFRERVSREAFEERARRYLDFERRPGARGVEAGGGGSGQDRETYTFVMEDGEGRRLRSSITVAHEDSFLYRRPPPPRVADFTVEDLPPKAPGRP